MGKKWKRRQWSALWALFDAVVLSGCPQMLCKRQQWGRSTECLRHCSADRRNICIQAAYVLSVWAEEFGGLRTTDNDTPYMEVLP